MGIKNKMENVAKKQAKGKDKSFCPSLAWKKETNLQKYRLKKREKARALALCVSLRVHNPMYDDVTLCMMM